MNALKPAEFMTHPLFKKISAMTLAVSNSEKRQWYEEMGKSLDDPTISKFYVVNMICVLATQMYPKVFSYGEEDVEFLGRIFNGQGTEDETACMGILWASWLSFNSYLTPSEAAKVTGKSETWWRQLFLRRRVCATKKGNLWLIPEFFLHLEVK